MWDRQEPGERARVHQRAQWFPVNEIWATQLNADSYGQMGYFIARTKEPEHIELYIAMHKPYMYWAKMIRKLHFA